MMKAKSILAGALAVIALAVAAPQVMRGIQLLKLGAADKAKVLCSAVFLAEREIEDVLNEDLSVEDLWPLRWLPVTVNRDTAMVTAGFPGLARQSAVFRPGLGCTLTQASILPVELPPRATPSLEMDLKATPDARLDPVLDWAFAEPDATRLRRTRAVIILQDGRVVGERYGPGFGPHTPLAGWSLAKVMVNALVGVLQGSGRLALGDSLGLPEWQSDEQRGITLEHLLHMSSGLEFHEEYGEPLQDVTRMLLLEKSAAAYAAGKPLIAPPGSRWYYASGSSNIISRYLHGVLGADYDGFPRKALFEPLGMTSAVMEQDAAGDFVMSSFMYATARDWAKLGQLYLQDGQWQGRRIFPKGWTGYSLKPAPAAPGQEYAAHLWLKVPDTYRSQPALAIPGDAYHAIGFEGQFITILPARGLVLVRLGLTRSTGAWLQDEFIGRVLTALPP